MAAQTLTSDSILPALVGLVELAAWRLRAFEGPSPASEAADQYRHDPANPVPTISGPCAVMPCTCRRGHEINVRLNHAMTFSYTLRAFTQDVEVTGPVTLELFVKSSAVDTD